MVTALEVDVNKLLARVAEELKKRGIEKPDFVDYVKSGAHVERPPEQEDFWYMRCAAILRYLYAHGPTGVQRLRSHFGGRKRIGRKPEHKRKAGGKIIRTALQILEKAGLVKKADDAKGRAITPEGISLLDRCAKDVVNS